MAALRIAGAALAAALLGARGLRKGSLDASGAVAAAAVGFLTLAAGLRYGRASRTTPQSLLLLLAAAVSPTRPACA